MESMDYGLNIYKWRVLYEFWHIVDELRVAATPIFSVNYWANPIRSGLKSITYTKSAVKGEGGGGRAQMPTDHPCSRISPNFGVTSIYCWISSDGLGLEDGGESGIRFLEARL